MSKSGKNPEELISSIIAFIENERDVFGDFSVYATDKNVRKDDISTSSSENISNSEEEITSSDENKSVSGEANNGSVSENASEETTPSENEKSIYDQIDECETLQELKELCKKADVLKTDLEGTRLVFGVGNPDADLMLIGEAPGEEEDKQGEPFVGRAGKLLDKILDAIDFDREDIYIANILKHRPPNNRNPKPEERQRSLPFLLKQIDLVNPKLILALGKVAAQTLLDSNDSLSGMRGKFHNFRDEYELLATYHPAALLRNPNWKRPTWEDVQKLRERYDELDCSP